MREEENSGRKKKKRRKRARRKPSKLAYILMFIIVALCATAACVVVFFKVDTVTVTGKSSYSNSEIIKASGIKTGTNLLRIDKQSVEENICSALPFIAKAKVKLSLPSTVKIEVTADSPKYAVNVSKKVGYLDENLKALELSGDSKKYKNVITISGVEVTKFEPGKVISFKDKSQSETIERLSEAIKGAGLSKITSMDVADSYQISVTYDNRIKIILGTSLGLDEKLSDAAAIIKSEIKDSDKGSLDVSAQNKRYIFSPS